MPAHIYAEHLINIRTLTIQVSLSNPTGHDTAITTNGDVLSLSHHGETTSVKLPVSLPAGDSPKLSIPSVPSTDLSFRVRLPDTGSPQDHASSETVIPWTAASLSPQADLQCKTCAAVILPGGKIQTWKDLPSEGWAEMMEFWHCHKPNEPHNHEQQTDKKGYSADSTLAITPSVGLVNATSFMLAAEDCNNIEVGDACSHFLSTGNLIHRALKRTGAFRPQGYRIWKIRDIAAQEQTLAAQNQLNPCASYGFSGEAMLISLATSLVVSRSSWARRRSHIRYILVYSDQIHSYRLRSNFSDERLLINLSLR